MAKPTKADREAAAIKKLDASAVVAQERITAAADKAQRMINDACDKATSVLELSARIPDKRNINGSFQWDRGDRYRRGSDERIQRCEDKVSVIDTSVGFLEVGQAKREEQIIGLIHDVKSVSRELDLLRDEFGNMNKELTSRMTTHRELLLQVKDEQEDKVNELRSETLKDKIRNQQYVIGIVVGMVVTFLSSVIFAWFR